jgi:hypothetical protein
VIAMPYRDAATYRPPRPLVAHINHAAARLADWLGMAVHRPPALWERGLR